MAGPVFAHTGVSGHTSGASSVHLQKNSTTIKESGCCIGKMYSRDKHHINAEDCCANHCIPVVGLPASIVFKDLLCFAEPKGPATSFVSIYLSPGYSSVWLPPKID